MSTENLNPDFFAGLDLDLSDILSEEQIAEVKARTQREKKLKAKLKPQAPEPEVAKVKPSPWRATKVILLMTETQCKCGATFLHPAAKMPLAHFDHIKKPDTVWEVAAHPSTLNEKLPRETRILQEHVEACPHCFGGES